MKPSRITAFCLALAVALPAAAQFRKPEDAVRYRQSVMNTMGFSFYGRLGGMVNNRVPFDAKVAQEHADLVLALSKLPWITFTPDTNGVGKTAAKPEIWTEQAKFKESTDKMQAEVVKLQAAAKTGDLDALKAAYRATGAACKSCHDAFTTQ